MELVKESVSEFKHGLTNVGTARTQLTISTPALKGVLLKTPGDLAINPNTAPVFVGGAGVTADATATGGIPLLPGDSISIPIADPSHLYLVSTEPDQNVFWSSI